MDISFHIIASYIVPLSNEAQSYPFSENPPNVCQVFLSQLIKRIPKADFRTQKKGFLNKNNIGIKAFGIQKC
jgi:hypothetical protein